MPNDSALEALVSKAESNVVVVKEEDCHGGADEATRLECLLLYKFPRSGNSSGCFEAICRDGLSMQGANPPRFRGLLDI